MPVEQITWGGKIPELHNHASSLLILANDIVSARSEPCDTTDLFGVMADVFMQKLIDHLKSILVLVDAGQYQDATIIARSSYESMGLVLWSADGPRNNSRESRPLQWFAYEFIDRYHQMERYRQLGIEPDPETERAIRRGVQEYADLFLTKDASNAISKGEAPKKRLFIDRIKFGKIVDELLEKGLIDLIAHQRYTMLSQWPHGTSQGMGIVFHYDGQRVAIDKETCKSLGADAIIIGIRSLGDTAFLYNNHFKLNFHDNLIAQHKDFSNFLLNMRAYGLY